ncbi:EamA family transporter [Chloroflexota bacterium]
MGIILAITASCCWAAAAILARLGLSTGIRASTATFVSMASSFLLAGLLALIIDYEAVVSLTPAAFLWFGLIGIVTYVLGRQFNYAAIRRIGAVRASPLFASAPLFALILAVSFLGESINPAIVIGTLIIIGGLYLVVTGNE